MNNRLIAVSIVRDSKGNIMLISGRVFGFVWCLNNPLWERQFNKGGSND